MQRLEVSGVVVHIYIYIIIRLKVNILSETHLIFTMRYKFKNPRPYFKLSSLKTCQSEAGGHQAGPTSSDMAAIHVDV
jgi:hypothetical protein